LKQHCLKSEEKLLDDGRISEETHDLFKRCKKLEGNDITKEDFQALSDFAKHSSKFQGEYVTENI
jgi:hypothetical protein